MTSTMQDSFTEKGLSAGLAFTIVVYREVFFQTKAFVSLVAALQQAGEAAAATIFIHDNTDTANWLIDFDASTTAVPVRYLHDATNPGISKAYNRSAEAARSAGYEWMVFLDQDTFLPPEAVAEYLGAIRLQPETFLKIPVLEVGHSVFSPFRMLLKRAKRWENVQPGIVSFRNHAFVNSGLLVNLPFFFQVGGYNESVKLDFTDFLFLERARKAAGQFEILPFRAQHEFSHDEPDINKALKRYAIFEKDLSNCPRNHLADVLGYAVVGWLHLLKLSYKHRSLRFLKVKLRTAKDTGAQARPAAESTVSWR